MWGTSSDGEGIETIYHSFVHLSEDSNKNQYFHNFEPIEERKTKLIY